MTTFWKMAWIGALCLLSGLIFPVAAFAGKGSGGGGSDHGGSSGGSSGSSGGSGSSGSGHSGSGSGHSDDGGSDDSGSGSSGGSGHGGSDGSGGSRNYSGGWREQISNGRYELFDPEGRLVIRRSAKQSDRDRLH